MWAKIEAAQEVNGDLAGEAKAVAADAGDLLAGLVERANLCATLSTTAGSATGDCEHVRDWPCWRDECEEPRMCCCLVRKPSLYM